jgi:hypothetical protein
MPTDKTPRPSPSVPDPPEPEPVAEVQPEDGDRPRPSGEPWLRWTRPKVRQPGPTPSSR